MPVEERDRERMIEEYVAGATSSELAAKYGCTDKVVTRAVRKAGFVVRPRDRVTLALAPETATGREALRLVRGGQSAAEAGRAVGLSRQRVHALIVRFGLGVQDTVD